MKKIFITTALALTLASFVSCRENNTGVEHHSESGSAEDNIVNNPSTAPTADSTQTGNSATSPAGNTGTGGNTTGDSPPDSIKPLN
jgi:hypothetical protein